MSGTFCSRAECLNTNLLLPLVYGFVATATKLECILSNLGKFSEEEGEVGGGLALCIQNKARGNARYPVIFPCFHLMYIVVCILMQSFFACAYVFVVFSFVHPKLCS